MGTTFPGCHCAIGRDVYAFVPNQEMNYKYTLYAIQAAAADVVVKAKGLIPGLTKADILEHYVYIPVIEEQHEIVRRVEQLFAYADTIEKQVNSALTRINSLTQSILAKAFHGELTAQWRAENPDLISGENSATALLEKIKAERAASGGKNRAEKSLTLISSAPEPCAFLHFILQVASALAAFAHPSHVFIYAPGDSFSCRLDAAKMIFCILFFVTINIKNISCPFLCIPITVYFQLDFPSIP